MSAGLSANGIMVAYGRNVAVDRVSIDVAPSQIVGLIGPNGAGKTSFIDAISGFTALGSGRVELDGRDITPLPAHVRANLGLRRTFQQLRLFDDLTIRENLVVAVENDTRFGAIRDLFRPRRDTVATARTLELCGLTDVADQLPRDLPAGTRRIVGVARAIVAEPSILLLDEPAAGLDTHETQALGEMLTRLATTGVGMLLIEHDTDLVFRVCSDVVAIDFGVTIAAGPADEVRSSEALISAYLGTATIESEPADRLAAPHSPAASEER